MSAISVIIPASNESAYIQRCLDYVLKQDFSGQAQVIVVANGCRDDTAHQAAAQAPAFAARGWRLQVQETPIGDKINALNLGDSLAEHGMRLYLDADIEMEPTMLTALAEALSVDLPRYAGGRLIVAPTNSRVTRAYGRFWSRLPFMTQNVTGAGLFAVNEAGRARWGAFPPLISDDTFIRLQFSETERVLVDSGYRWPLAEGFKRLVRVRRRQDRGVQEIASAHPTLMTRQGKTRPGRMELIGLALRDPIGFTVYTSVALAVRIGPADNNWTRGR